MYIMRRLNFHALFPGVRRVHDSLSIKREGYPPGISSSGMNMVLALDSDQLSGFQLLLHRFKYEAAGCRRCILA